MGSYIRFKQESANQVFKSEERECVGETIVVGQSSELYGWSIS